MKDISVIIPAYNEAERIVPTITGIYSFLAGRSASFEIIVIDDGSTDHTVAVVTQLQSQMPELLVQSPGANKGKGHAVRQGMLAAKGALILFTDADGSTPISELDKLLQQLTLGKTDIAIGSRYIPGSEVVKVQSRMRVLWSRMVNHLVQRVLLPGIADPHCGFKLFTADAARSVFPLCRVDGWSFDLEVLALAQRLHYTIVEVPVRWANDERSKAKITHLPRELYSFYKIRNMVAKANPVATAIV